MFLTDTRLEATCFSLMTSLHRAASPQPAVTDPASAPTALGTESACTVPASWKIPAPTFNAILGTGRCCKGDVDAQQEGTG